MSSLRWRFLAPAALLLAVVGRCSGLSSHSLRYFYTVVSEPGPRLPEFSILGYVDSQLFNKYDSILRRDVPIASWMGEFGKEDPQYWERNTRDARTTESRFRVHLATLQDRHSRKNATRLHTLQWMYGCEMGPDGQPGGGNYQYAYDGVDFITLDMKTFTWTASDPLALDMTRRWETERQWARRTKVYLEETCVEWLQRYLVYRNETLQRTEAPTARVSRKKGYNGRETLFCHLYGFHPKEIEVTWMKDGEDQKPETLTGGVVPNSDGTFHTWLSIEVDPKERNRYRCRVEHDSLPGPLDLAGGEPDSNWGLILGVPGGILAVVSILVAGVVIFLRRRQKKGYNAASRSDQGSDASTSVSVSA